MRLIDRSKTAPPPSLSNYHHTTHSWEEEPGKIRFCGEDKKALRATLELLQNSCCAYCESATQGKGHIEHFRRKSPDYFPHLMFAWENLFLSCSTHEHCGHYKDRKGSHYNPNNLIKPDHSRPDDFLYFHSDGDVRTRSGLDSSRKRIADETIRVFNLRCGSLCAKRRRALEEYKRLTGNTQILDELMSFSESDRQAYIDLELKAVADQPHSTTIRHFFEKSR